MPNVYRIAHENNSNVETSNVLAESSAAACVFLGCQHVLSASEVASDVEMAGKPAAGTRFIFRVRLLTRTGLTESVTLLTAGKDSGEAQAQATRFVNAAQVLSVSELARDVEIAGEDKAHAPATARAPIVAPLVVPPGLNDRELAILRAAVRHVVQQAGQD